MHVSTKPRRLALSPSSIKPQWLALYPSYYDLETGVYEYQRRVSWLESALLQLPASLRWALTQRYQLRLSTPANVCICAMLIVASCVFSYRGSSAGRCVEERSGGCT